jgi:hypothetical protein
MKKHDVEFKLFSDEYMLETFIQYTHIDENCKKLRDKYFKKVYEKYPQIFNSLDAIPDYSK